MRKVFVRSAQPCTTAARSWPISCDPHVLLHALTRAAALAARTGVAVPASVVLALPQADPLRIWQAFQALAPGECFYWEQPARQVSLVGAGVALSMYAQGEERFAEAVRVWQRVRAEIVVASDLAGADHGPVLLGGFGFDPARPRSERWRRFPAGLLVLPRLLFRQQADGASITCSVPVHATADLADLAEAIGAEVARLRDLLDGPDAMAIPAGSSSPQPYMLRDLWPAQSWKELVGRAVSSLRQGTYAKIVLAREAEVTGCAFDLARTLENLRRGYASACVFAWQRGEQAFIGATPERLVRAHDGRLHTLALAGSAPRGANAEEDRLLGSELLRSPKNRSEHEIVIAMLRDSLAHLCSRVRVAQAPELLRLPNIQHLQTAIEGELLSGRTLLEALQVLHPTPAVGGTPTEAALRFIREQENLDRGWYAGPLGWVDLEGNGEFVVALRSALLEPRQATLFAGCGIVHDSHPEAEYAESCLKLEVILRSLAREE